MFCLAFPYDLDADVSNGILLKIPTLIKSTQRFVTGHLEVIYFVTLGETLTLVHQVLWWTFRGSLRRSLECLSGKRCLAVLPFKYYAVCECVCVEFFLAASLPVSFCASVCLSLGAFWAAEWNAGVAETVLWSKLFRLGNLSAGNLGSLVERVCLLWWWGTGWEQGDCPSHFTPQNQTWLVWLGRLVGFILGGFVRDWQQKVWFL